MSHAAQAYARTSHTMATPREIEAQALLKAARQLQEVQTNWTGKYANNKSFTVHVSGVSGFHAKVHYLSDGTSKYQDVLIKDGSFRVGDTKFTLLNNGKAQIKNVVTDPATGSTYLDTAYATLQQ